MLALITSHFNFIGYDRLRQNLYRFVTQMKSFGYPLYGVEAYLPGQVPFTLAWKNWRQIRIGKDQIMFQKEALLNLAEKMVPPVYDKIAWIDADLWFADLKWYENTEKKLGDYRVLQLFKRCLFSQQTGRPFHIFHPFATESKKAHSGFAWAARRELWTKLGGLYPYGVLGCGDGLAARAFVANEDILPGSAGSNPSEYRRWQKQVTAWVDGKCSIVEGDVYHEWHGTLRNRAYIARRYIIKDVDLTRVTALAANQLLTWTPEAPDKLKTDVHNYFLNRNEDA